MLIPGPAPSKLSALSFLCLAIAAVYAQDLASSSSGSSIIILLSSISTLPPTAASTAPASSTIECLRFRKTGFWEIDIDNRPALPRECAPPFSRNADRDPAHLPYQIAALCGSYVACVAGVGLALLSIRRRRKRLLDGAYSSLSASAGTGTGAETHELKLVQNESRKFEEHVSPVSPATSFASWMMRNPLRKRAGSGLTLPGAGDGVVGEISSPGMLSIASFDHGHRDAQQEMRQAEMDRLYAAVMVHDAARRSQKSDVDTISQLPPTRFADRRLERVARQDVRAPPSPTTPGIPETPKVPVRAIYPPSYDLSNVPLSPTSPVRATVPDDFWPQQGRQRMPIARPQRQFDRPLGLASPTLPLSPTTPRIELPNDMYPASPPPGGRRMRLPAHAGQAFPLSPGGPVTPISPGPMSAAMFPGMAMGPASPRYQLPNDMYPASPPLQSHPMTLPPPPSYDEPIRRPASTRSVGSRAETESITSNRSGKGRRMIKNMRINTGASLGIDAEERAPLSATFQKDTQDPVKDSSASNTPDTPRATDFDDRFDALSSTLPQIPQTRLGTPPRRSTPKLHSRGPSLTSINTNVRGVGHAPMPASPALSHVSNRSIGLPSGPKSGVLPATFTSYPRPGSSRAAPPAPLSSTSTAAFPAAPTPTRSPAPANAPGGSKPLALRVQFGDSDLHSPAATKTTFLERRKEAALRMTNARTPGTAVPQTPYSAYMPFTPVTPVTPHLVSRQERRQRKKEMGRSVLRDTDMVREEDEEWD